jgi:hypothetical protein
VVLWRANAHAFSFDGDLPESLDEFISEAGVLDKQDVQTGLEERCLPLWTRDTILVLHGTSTHPAALDLESKFMEAALGNLHVPDYRNFAHGRHYWLAKRAETTAVLALIAEEDRDLADRTLRRLPVTVPVARIHVPHTGPMASLAALVLALQIVLHAGKALNVDPGRPHVLQFGRRIYRLKAFPRHAAGWTAKDSTLVAIERKAGMSIASLKARGDLERWQRAYGSFVRGLERTSFGGAIFDYDGTLLDHEHRFFGPDDRVLQHLQRLLSAGVAIGIATGHGKSVRADLRRILVENLWPRVVIGYYNGAESGRLDEDSCPDAQAAPCLALAPIAQFLSSDRYVCEQATCTFRQWQITLEPRSQLGGSELWDIAQHAALAYGQPGVMVVRSSHSVDILAPGVSKRSLVTSLKNATGGTLPVLCVGDRGRWPGNDAALLMEPHALSADEVSPDPLTCWNLAPPGYRGVQATLTYLAASRAANGVLRLAVRSIGKRAT